MFVDSQTEFGESSSPSSTLVKQKTLSDVYARCNVNMIEPKRYEEATIDNAWKKTMNIEIEMDSKEQHM